MATGGLHLSRRLEQMLPGVVSKRYQLLHFYEGVIAPTVADLEVGAAEVVRESMTEVGDAAIVSDGAWNMPIVDLSADETRYRVVMFASAFSYTFQQMRAMEKAGNANTINNRKQMLAMRAIAERVNHFAAFGNSSLGITGFINDAGVTANNSTFDLDDAATTPDAIAEFFIDQAATVAEDSNGTFMAGDVLVSHPIYTLLAKTRMTDGSQTLINYLLENPYISSIKWLPELKAATLAANSTGQASKDRIIFYPFERIMGDNADPMLEMDQPEIIERHVEPTQLMPNEYWENRNGRTVIPMFMCCTPTMINYKESMRYVDVPVLA